MRSLVQTELIAEDSKKNLSRLNSDEQISETKLNADLDIPPSRNVV